MRIVLDTNVLIAAARNRSSSSRRIVEACLAGQSRLVISEPMEREYRFILSRALRGCDDKFLATLIDQATCVQADRSGHTVPEDPDDAIFLATAVAGRAEVIVSNDRHLLVLSPYAGIRILRPSEFVELHLKN